MKREYERPMEWDSFVLYKSQFAPISDLSDDALGRLFRRLFQWQIDGEATPEDDISMAFKFIVNQFRVDDMKREAKCQINRENGKAGGRPKKTERFQEKRTLSKKANGGHNENENENENENLFDSVDAGAPTPKSKKFVKPTLEEVRAYCESRGNNVDAGRFIDYYESVGWKVGKSPMKDWRAAVRQWERNERQGASTSQQPTQGRRITCVDDIWEK